MKTKIQTTDENDPKYWDSDEAKAYEGVWIEKKWLDKLLTLAEELSYEKTLNSPESIEKINYLIGYISSIERKV